ncbi:MAG: hypothetical protein R2877_02475 [Bdellovibrionota bacterium]
MKTWFNSKSMLPALSFIGVMACSSVAGDTFVRLKVTSDPGSTTIGNAIVNPSNIEFTVAKLVISEVELEKGVDCSVEDDSANDDANEFEYEGPFVVDLIAEKAIPSLDEVKIEKAKYCKFKFKLDKLEDDEIPAGVSDSASIVDNSVYIEGIYDSTTPFVVKLDEDEDFEMESESASGLAFANGELNTIFLVFDLGNLFQGVDDFADLDQDGGVVYIDKDNNEDAYDTIRENLKTFSKLYKDSNDDDELDDDDDELASGSN